MWKITSSVSSQPIAPVSCGLSQAQKNLKLNSGGQHSLLMQSPPPPAKGRQEQPSRTTHSCRLKEPSQHGSAGGTTSGNLGGLYFADTLQMPLLPGKTVAELLVFEYTDFRGSPQQKLSRILFSHELDFPLARNSYSGAKKGFGFTEHQVSCGKTHFRSLSVQSESSLKSLFPNQSETIPELLGALWNHSTIWDWSVDSKKASDVAIQGPFIRAHSPYRSKHTAANQRA
jgi:hypothetical protein